MLMQNVPRGTGKGPSPADRQDELFVHDTLGQTVSSRPVKADDFTETV